MPVVEDDIYRDLAYDVEPPPPLKGLDPAGFVIHSAVHAAREEVGCVLHTHTVNGIGVSAQKAGVLPISQQSIFVLSSLGYAGAEIDRLAAAGVVALR